MKIKCHIILDKRAMDQNQTNAVNEPLDAASVTEGMNYIRKMLNSINDFIEINDTYYNRNEIVSISVFEDE